MNGIRSRGVIRYARMCALLAIGAVLLVAQYSRGAVVVQKSISEMAESADLVVEGEVEGKLCRWDESNRYIITEVFVDVTKLLKGVSSGRITVRVLGGEVGDTGLMVPGAPNFAVGEEVLLFLESHPTRDWRVMGFHQGKLEITTNPETGQKYVRGVAQPVAQPLQVFETRLEDMIKGKKQ
jgi:hypothetical protein